MTRTTEILTDYAGKPRNVVAESQVAAEALANMPVDVPRGEWVEVKPYPAAYLAAGRVVDLMGSNF